MKLNNIFATALMLGSMAAASVPATAQEALTRGCTLYYKNTNGLLSFPMWKRSCRSGPTPKRKM